MPTYAALFLLCAAASSAARSPAVCDHPVQCPCGGKNLTICLEQPFTDHPCSQWEGCKSCQDGMTECLECPDGLEGPFCTKVKLSRQKRQNRFSTSNSWRQYQSTRVALQGYPAEEGGCRDMNTPKLGSIECSTLGRQRTCTGTCLPGYTFENMGSETQIQLRCQNGVWTPMRSFPPCRSGGYCALEVVGHGSFNCTIGMQGTRCDVRCSDQYVGQYSCYPGQSWQPPLPRCLRPKGDAVPEATCRCEYGGSCDRYGNCICPVGRTGTFCESIQFAERRTCSDPGFITDGHRRNMDGTQSTTRRRFENGESVVFGCNADEDALRGSAFLVCNDGRWSGSLPRCIKPVVTQEAICSDPGQVPNADRLNSDGTPSLGVQRYEAGQSVAYTCRPGFALQRRSLITCQSTGSWSNSLPYCTPINSPAPVTRSTTTVNPNRGAFCRDPGVDPNGSRKPSSAPDRRGFPPGSRLEFSCNPNFDLEGEGRLFCLVAGRWSAQIPTCKDQSRSPVGDDYCPHPGSFKNGRVLYYPDINSRKGLEEDLEELEYPSGSRLQYNCDAEYTLVGATILMCQESGEWSADPPTCTVSDGMLYCPNPGILLNGQVQYLPQLSERRRPPSSDADDPEYPVGARLQYSCDAGYILEGSDLVTCRSTGLWSDKPPVCTSSVSGREAMYCDNPDRILDGRVTPILPDGSAGSVSGTENVLEYPEGTRLQYTCEEGYLMIGAPVLTCQPSGHWSSESPICSAECGISFMQTSRRVINGDKTKAGEWPWVVAIAVRENNVSRIICGGAVINSRTVVTAAHCLVADPLTLYFGKLHRYDKNDDEKVMRRQSTRMIRHPDFNSSTFDSDIGLIMFPAILFTDRVQPICLPSFESTARNLMTGGKGYVTGWGLTEHSLPADRLLLAQLPYLNNDECSAAYRRQEVNLPISRNMFCAGFKDGQQSACTGDSGSPLVFYDRPTRRYTLEGLVSFGVVGQCGLPERYTVFTKVSLFAPWILRNLL